MILDPKKSLRMELKSLRLSAALQLEASPCILPRKYWTWLVSFHSDYQASRLQKISQTQLFWTLRCHWFLDVLESQAFGDAWARERTTDRPGIAWSCESCDIESAWMRPETSDLSEAMRERITAIARVVRRCWFHTVILGSWESLHLQDICNRFARHLRNSPCRDSLCRMGKWSSLPRFQRLNGLHQLQNLELLTLQQSCVWEIGVKRLQLRFSVLKVAIFFACWRYRLLLDGLAGVSV